MKLLHTADLHIGKIVNEFSMLEDQKYVLNQILQIVKEEEIDGVLISGDVYDRSIPPAEAVSILDWFLTTLIEREVKVFVIAGNHDSAERVGFASSILDGKGLYIGGTYDGNLRTIRMEKANVIVDITLLPFVKPQVVQYYKEETIRTYEEGVQCSLKDLNLDHSVTNILLAHHFVTAGGVDPEQSDSETEISLGGIDKVDTSVFDEFDYVALGHIHRPQRIGRDTIRYAGSPIKYSFSEVHHKKSVAILEIGENKEIDIQLRELKPLHDMRVIRGSIDDLMNPEYYMLADRNDYIQATLTDTVELVDPIGTMRSVYPNIMQLILEKNHGARLKVNQDYKARKTKTPLELFEEFYVTVTNRELDETREKIMVEVLERAKEEVER